MLWAAPKGDVTRCGVKSAAVDVGPKLCLFQAIEGSRAYSMTHSVSLPILHLKAIAAKN